MRMSTSSRRALLQPPVGVTNKEEAPTNLVHPYILLAADLQWSQHAVAMTTLVLVLICLIGYFTLLARRCLFGFNSHRHRSPNPTALVSRYSSSGLNPSTIRALPLRPYYSDEKVGGCMVCLGDLEEGERVKLIPACGHIFHPTCIDTWLASRGSCPICRCSHIFASTSFKEEEENVVAAADDDFQGGGEVRRVLGRSRSWCSTGEENTVFLRRTYSA